MPTSLSIGAFVLGAVLLLISVVSGGFKIFGAEVSGSSGRLGRLVAFVAGVVLIITGFLHEAREKSSPAESRTDVAATPQAPTIGTEPVATPQASTHLTARDTSPIVQQSAKRRDAAVSVQWRAGIPELMAIAASLSDAEKMTLGYNAMLTGQDVYGIYVRITNVGGVAIDVSPDDLRFSYNGVPVPLMRAEDRRFLQPTRIEPNHYADGVMTFNAPIALGGAVLANGRLSYQASGVQVTYK